MNTEAPGKFRVVLVEDHPMFREQLAQLINREPEMIVCGEADNIHDALQLVESKGADIAIVDLTLKGPSGLELIKNLKAKELDVPVLVLSMHDESLYAERVLKAGGRGYISGALRPESPRRCARGCLPAGRRASPSRGRRP